MYGFDSERLDWACNNIYSGCRDDSIGVEGGLGFEASLPSGGCMQLCFDGYFSSG